MKRKYSFLVGCLTAFVLTACQKGQDQPAPTPPPSPTPITKVEAQSHVVTPKGGSFEYQGDIKLIIPEAGVKENTQVEVKYAQKSEDLELGELFEPIGKEIILNLKSEVLTKPFKLEFMAPEGFDPERTMVIQYPRDKQQGEARALEAWTLEQLLYPNIDYTADNKVTLEIDALAQLRKNGQLTERTENAFRLVIDKRIAAKEQKLLRAISFDGERMQFNLPGNLTGKRCLLFVHGWTSNPKDCWSKFAKFATLNKVKNDYNYDVILTFGYHSGLRIDHNGKLLSEEIKKHLINSTLDIVAHSMGGLVSRSAIEHHLKLPYVRSLITLGTPHRGSPWSTWGGSRLGSLYYNLPKEGGIDLAEDSEFIKKLARNPRPSTKYYYIAGRIATVTTKTLFGNIPSDGAVGVTSALNGTTGEQDGKIFDFYGEVLPHTLLPDDSRVMLHVLDKLKEFAGANTPKVDENTPPEGVVIENGVLKVWPAVAIPVGGHVTVPTHVTSIGDNAFKDCRNLKSITLPEGLHAIGASAFQGCSSLKAITIPNTVQTLRQSVFSGCFNLVTVKLPNTIQSIERHAFLDCQSLTEIELGENLLQMGTEVFVRCTSLKSIILPSSLGEISSGSFKECTNLVEVIIPNSITYIGSEAFENCTALSTLSLPQSLKKIYATAINGCTKLQTVVCKSTSPPFSYRSGWGGDYTSPLAYKGKLIVPKGRKETYQSNDGWSQCNPIVEEE